MLSSVTSIESTGLASNRGVSRFPGLRAAAVLAAIGSMTLAAAGQDYDGSNSGEFNDALNWTNPGFPGGYPDFAGGIIDIIGGTDINVDDLIIGIGGLNNSSDGDIVFSSLLGTGSFTFNDSAIINPGAGSFTFEIDVFADGSLTFDLTGDGAVQIDGNFTTNGGTILADGGFVEINGETTSGEGTIWNANDGGFNFNGVFNATGAQTFAGTSGTVADDVFTFDDVNFLTGAVDLATFDAATANFNGTTTVAAGYGFSLDNAAVVTFNDFAAEGNHTVAFVDADSTFSVTGDASFIDTAILTVTGDGNADFSGEVTLGQNFTASLTDADSELTFRGETIFETDTTLTVQGLGTFELDGTTELPGPFTLLVNDDATVNWIAATTVDGDFTINTTGGAGNANVNFGTDGVVGGGGFANAPGADDLTISITTNGTDDTVKFAGGFLREFTGTIDVTEDSAVTFQGGGSGGNGTVSLDLNTGTEVTLNGGTAGGTIAFDQLNGEGDIELTGDKDITLSVKGGGSLADPETGLFTGDISEGVGPTGSLSLTVTEGTFNYGGFADYTGNTTISGGGTFRIDGDGLTTGLVENTDSLLITGGDLLLETSARLEGSGSVGLAAGSTIDITADATNGANLQFDNAGDINGAVTLSGDRLATYNLILGNNTVDATTIQGSITASGNSGASFSGDVTVGRQGQLLLEDTAIAEVGGDLTLEGLIDLSGTTEDGLTVTGGATLSGGSTIQAAGNRTLTIEGDSTMAAGAGLLLEEDSVATFNSELDLAATAGDTQGATLSLTGDSTLNVTGAVTGDGNLTLEDASTANLNADTTLAVIQAADTSTVNNGGNLDLTGNSVFEGGTTLTVGGMLDLADGAMLDLQGTDLDAMNLTATGGIMVNSGATLMANANVDTSELTYAGTLEVGVNSDSSGVLNLNTGDLVSDGSDAILNINLTGEYVNDLDAGTYGQTSVINVASGSADFSDNGSNRLFVNIADEAYIPDDKDIALLQTSSNRVGNADVTTSQDMSVTRTWTIDQMDPLSIMAHSAADYAAPLEGTTDYLRGVELNSLRAEANLDPTSDSGILLGQLDAIDSEAAYEAAVEGVGPTTQVSTIQLAANTQYFNVLRKEIRRRYANVKQRTPAPFRLSNGTQYASAQDDASQAKIRRNIRQPATAEGFGVFWGRSLDTPTDGDIIGISGNEYGGIGGFAWELGSDFVGGVNLGYSQISGDLDGGFGNTRVGTVRGGGFVSWANSNGLFFDVAAAGAWNHYKFNRVVPNTQLSADSNADGFQLDLSLGGGYRIELSESWAITPEASFMYSYVNTGNIEEDSSSAAALSISPGDLNSIIGRVGGGLSWSALPGLVVDAELGWQGNFNFNGNYDVSLLNQATSVNVSVDNQTINTAYYGLGVNWTPTYNVNVSIQYEGRNGEGFNSNMFYGGVSIGF